MQDPAFVQFPDFLGYVKRTETVEAGPSGTSRESCCWHRSLWLDQATKSSDVGKEMEGMKASVLMQYRSSPWRLSLSV